VNEALREGMKRRHEEKALLTQYSPNAFASTAAASAAFRATRAFASSCGRGFDKTARNKHEKNEQH
jgi:hypothetical protein